MVKKKNYRNQLHLKVPQTDMTFKQRTGGHQAFYDRSLLEANLPPTTGVLTADKTLLKTLGHILPAETTQALEATEFVNVFGRVVESPHSGVLCLQYLYVWDYQAVPAHEADYEPIFVFIDKNRRYAIYDLVHYCSRRLNLAPPGVSGPGLRMVPGWHSFLPDSSIPVKSVDKKLEVQPLSDQHLTAWWSIADVEPRLKIKEYIRDPFLLEAPGHFMKNPDENARTICCTFLEIERAFQEFESPREGLIEGMKRAFGNCVGLLALHRLAAYIQLLNEMNNVGLVSMPTALSAGLNIASVGTMLKDGFVSLTKAGKSLFSGMGESHEDDHDKGKSGGSVKDSVI
ncbi:MAG: hypothetical protein ACE5H4_13895 [Candidatus Thorarchaeota archaeon]